MISYVIARYMKHNDNIVTQRGGMPMHKEMAIWRFQECGGMFMVGGGGAEGLKVMV